MGSKSSKVSRRSSTTAFSEETNGEKTKDEKLAGEGPRHGAQPGTSRGRRHTVGMVGNALEPASTAPTSNDAIPKPRRGRRKTLDPQVYQSAEIQAFLKKRGVQNTSNGGQKKKNTNLQKTKKKKPSRNSVQQQGPTGLQALPVLPGIPGRASGDAEEAVRYEDYEFPFENVVFEGGGNKGLAYAGAVRELERIGAWAKIRRFSGASAGAMWAALSAIGYNSHEVQEFLSMNLKEYFMDEKCATCRLFPNLLRHFGWHPARRLFEWFGDRLEEMTGDADVTFKQLYERLGKELCIVVTNLNHMDAEYCHVKTTPNMPIRIAVRMSMAIPLLFGAVRMGHDATFDVYVDGGVLCNYPIHCFDGWWLSMKPEDSMLARLQPLEDIGKMWDKKERFGAVNSLTIGLLLYSSNEQDVMVEKLVERKGNIPPQARPNTKLSRKRAKLEEKREKALENHAQITAAMSGFLRLVSEFNLDENSSISRSELQAAFQLNPGYFTETHRGDLFGDDLTVDEIFDQLNHDDDDEITFDELQAFAEKRGVMIQASFQGYGRKNISGLSDFLGALQDTLLVNVKRVFVTEEDINRTVGVDTVYIDTTDFVLEEEDRQFLVEQGVRGMQCFLRDYVQRSKPPTKRLQGAPRDSPGEDP